MMKIRKAKIAAIVILSLIAFGSCGKGDSDWTNYDTFEANQGGGGGGDDNTAPVANAGSNRHVEPGALVELDGSASYDKEGKPLTYSWTIKSRPAGSSAILSDGSLFKPAFTADKNGEYKICLNVNNGELSSKESIITICAYPTIDYNVIDAAYSRPMDRLIILSDISTYSVRIYDPNTLKSNSINLPDAPLSLSLSPDGTHASVSHAKSITYIDLSLNTIVKTIPVTKSIKYLILAGNGYIYAFSNDYNYNNTYSINISTESITEIYDFYALCVVPSLHPNGNSIYGGSQGLSPSDIFKYTTSSGPIQHLYDSPYHGDYEMEDKCWFSQDGTRIYASGFDILTSSEEKKNDIIYYGSMKKPPESVITGCVFIKSLDESVEKNRIALVAKSKCMYDELDVELRVYLYNNSNLQFINSIAIPFFINDNGDQYNGRGKYIFFKSGGEKYYVISQADKTSGITNDYTILEYDTE